MRPSASPSARHFAVAAQAVSTIQRLTAGAIELAASVSMKAPGATIPRSGWRQRISASAPTTASSDKLHAEAVARLRLCAHHGHEEAAPAAAVRLRLVQREIRIGDQLIDARAIGRRNRRAGTARDMQDLVVDLIGLREPLQRGVDEASDLQRITTARNDHDELVAAQPADLAARTDNLGKP